MTRTLNAYDKLHIALCALERSKDLSYDMERGCQEFETAMIWARDASKLWQTPFNSLI